MLAHIPARLTGCGIATRCLPGTLPGRVGGDRFDAVRLPGARTAFVVGDVVGHRLNSAATTGRLRTAVQTMAALDLPPAHLLRGLDDLAQRLGDTYLATCLYAATPRSPVSCASPAPGTSTRPGPRRGRARRADGPAHRCTDRCRRGGVRGGAGAGVRR
jgi:hypothetical protein